MSKSFKESVIDEVIEMGHNDCIHEISKLRYIIKNIKAGLGSYLCRGCNLRIPPPCLVVSCRDGWYCMGCVLSKLDDEEIV